MAVGKEGKDELPTIRGLDQSNLTAAGVINLVLLEDGLKVNLP